MWSPSLALVTTLKWYWEGFDAVATRKISDWADCESDRMRLCVSEVIWAGQPKVRSGSGRHLGSRRALAPWALSRFMVDSAGSWSSMEVVSWLSRMTSWSLMMTSWSWLGALWSRL